MENAAAGFEGFGPLVAVGYGKAVALAATERGFDQVAEPGGVDDDVAEAPGREPFEMPFDEAFAADAQQWFGQGVGQRPHAFAATRGEDHHLHLRHLCLRFARRALRRTVARRVRAGMRFATRLTTRFDFARRVAR